MGDGTRTRQAPGAVAYDDVNELIATATRLMQKDAAPDTLTPEDLRRIGEELDIPARYVDQALEALARRREDEARARERRSLLRRARLRQGALAGVVLVGVLAVPGLIVRNGLTTQLAEVARKRAQVRNVVERREALHARLDQLTPGLNRDAEVAGADNRVAVERRRYDERAAEYNASAASFPTSWVVRLSGLPPVLPLSPEVSSW
ncbi:LemA family protein [Corallococcus interemptor]|uniref:LemA family protein n=1 Tax=Corallococcus interemptor TaxID=2316720 RepID=UPI003D042131